MTKTELEQLTEECKQQEEREGVQHHGTCEEDEHDFFSCMKFPRAEQICRKCGVAQGMFGESAGKLSRMMLKVTLAEYGIEEKLGLNDE
mgnify:FL=1